MGLMVIAAAKIGMMRPPLLGRVRSDGLPENATYTDVGCEVALRCTQCPLERCRYEERNGLQAHRMRERNPQIIALRDEGAPVDEIAERFGLSPRSVFRVLAL